MKSGTKGIVAYNGKVLLILRDNIPNISFPNTWDFIGGGIEENETFEETGLREIEEEIGVKPCNYKFLGFDEFPNRKAGRFVALLTDDEFKSIKLGEEGEKYDFFTLDEALQLEMAPVLKNFLEKNLIPLKEIIENRSDIDSSKFYFFKVKLILNKLGSEYKD